MVMESTQVYQPLVQKEHEDEQEFETYTQRYQTSQRVRSPWFFFILNVLIFTVYSAFFYFRFQHHILSEINCTRLLSSWCKCSISRGGICQYSKDSAIVQHRLYQSSNMKLIFSSTTSSPLQPHLTKSISIMERQLRREIEHGQRYQAVCTLISISFMLQVI
jgi:hypothetical protein